MVPEVLDVGGALLYLVGLDNSAGQTVLPSPQPTDPVPVLVSLEGRYRLRVFIRL